MRRDPLIIGAGPAGSAAAIVLGRAGHRPVLIERATGPTDKVCGDFLSQDTIRQCISLGVDPAALGAAQVRRVRLVHRDRTAETRLPFPAMGLSRRILDAALLRQAEASGAILQTGQTVRRLVRERDRWILQCAGRQAISAETIFLATGKHDLRDQPRPRVGQGAVGMKMYFALRPEAAAALAETVELTLFPGGYAGMQPVEHGQAVLCIAVQQQAFQRLGGGWNALLAAVMASSRHFAARLEGARPALPRPLAVAGIPYGYQVQPALADGLFRLGDQAAVIPSLTGDGMAIALHTGQSAAVAWLAGSDAAAYHRGLCRRLRPQMRLAGWLHHAGMSGLTQAAGIQAARLFPALLRQASVHTRLPP